MITNTREAALQYLKAIQMDSLVGRFGRKEYLTKLKNYRASAPSFENYLEKNALNERDEKELKEYNDMLSRVANVFSTEYELSYMSRILAAICPVIEKQLQLQDLPKKNNIYFGVASSGIYNAFATPVTGTEAYLIILEDEIFTFCNLLSKIIIQALPKIEHGFNFYPSALKEHIDNSPFLQQRFDDLVVRGILGESPRNVQQYYLEESLSPFHWALLNSIEVFIVCHEYGHILSEHFASSLKRTAHIKGTETEIISTSWQQEYEADALGLNLMVSTVDSEMFPFSFIGPEVFFAFLDLEEQATLFYNTIAGKEVRHEDTHPPSVARKANIRNLLSERLPDNRREPYKATGEFIDLILESLWINNKNKIEEYFQLKKAGA